MGFIGRALAKFAWWVFVQGPLNLINGFVEIFKFISNHLFSKILFGLDDKNFSFANLPIQFWIFCIIAVFLFFVIFTINIIILLNKEATQLRIGFITSFKNGLKTVVYIFVIPIIFFIANYLVTGLSQIILTNSGSPSLDLASYLWHVGDTTWSGSIIEKTSFGAPGNIDDYNMIAQIFAVWFMLFAVASVSIVLIQKVIELFYLFIVSPIIMVMMTIDNGKAAFVWKDMVIAKFLASLSTIIGFQVFMIAISEFINFVHYDNNETFSNFTKQVFIITFLCAGALATLKFTDIAAGFIGEQVGIREGLNSFRSTITGSMFAMGAGKIAAKAIGFSKKTKSARNINQLNSIMSGDSAERVNNFKAATELYNSGLAARTGALGAIGAVATGTTLAAATFYATAKTAGAKTVTKKIAKKSVEPFYIAGKKFKDNFGINFKEIKKQGYANTVFDHKDDILSRKASLEKEKKQIEQQLSQFEKQNRLEIDEKQVKKLENRKLRISKQINNLENVFKYVEKGNTNENKE